MGEKIIMTKRKTAIYNVTITETTKNHKVVIYLMERKGCSEKRALMLLSKKNAVIAKDLSLNDASKVKSKINKFGYGAKINKVKDIYINDDDNSDVENNETVRIENKIKNDTITQEDKESNENIRILEEKLATAKALQKQREKTREKENQKIDDTSNSEMNKILNNLKNEKKSFNLKFKLLAFLITVLLFFIIFLLLMIFAPDKENLNLIDSPNKLATRENKSNSGKDFLNNKNNLLETIFVNKQKKMKSDIDLFNSNKNENNFLGDKSSKKMNNLFNNKAKNRITENKKTDKTIQSEIQMSMLDPKTFFSEKYSDINSYNKNIDKLEDLLLAIEDEDQRIMIRERIKGLKRKILSKKRNIDTFMKKFKKIYGRIKFTGNKFIGNTNLPDNLKVTIKITKPNKDLILKNKVIKDGGFSVGLNSSSFDQKDKDLKIIDKGEYSVKVNIRPKRFQNEDIRNYIDQILNSNNDNSEFIDKKISLAEDILEKKLYNNISDVKKVIKEFILDKKNPKTLPEIIESPTIENDKIYNIIIRDKNLIKGITKEDRIKAIVKSCAATGFTMNNYSNEGKNLKIYFNNSKFPDFSIPIERCKLAMKKVNNNFNDKKFMDLILDDKK